MALVPPLMDFSGPEFNVSLTYFPCLCAALIPCVQPQSDVCDFSKCLQHNPKEKIHPLTIPRERVKLTNNRISLTMNTTVSIY